MVCLFNVNKCMRSIERQQKHLPLNVCQQKNNCDTFIWPFRNRSYSLCCALIQSSENQSEPVWCPVWVKRLELNKLRPFVFSAFDLISYTDRYTPAPADAFIFISHSVNTTINTLLRFMDCTTIVWFDKEAFYVKCMTLGFQHSKRWCWFKICFTMF